MTKHYDYIAIGGGSGGIASINRAAMYGQKCALIEAKELGGTRVANNAVQTALAMKSAGTLIYSIGIFEGANPEQQSFGNQADERVHEIRHALQLRRDLAMPAHHERQAIVRAAGTAHGRARPMNRLRPRPFARPTGAGTCDGPAATRSGGSPLPA